MSRGLIIALSAGAAALAVVISAIYFTARPKAAPAAADAGESESAADLVNGKVVYDYWCAACHDPGPGHPGTQSLEVKYGGEMPAALEERTDLSPELTAYFVRNGFALMPFFRKTEISDADLRDLAAYLAQGE